jgi:hypothetical protein
MAKPDVAPDCWPIMVLWIPDLTHYLDQSKEGKSVRAAAYENPTRFFGKMSPAGLKTVHGLPVPERAGAQSGAPIKADKELSQLSTICNYAVRGSDRGEPLRRHDAEQGRQGGAHGSEPGGAVLPLAPPAGPGIPNHVMRCDVQLPNWLPRCRGLAFSPFRAIRMTACGSSVPSARRDRPS